MLIRMRGISKFCDAQNRNTLRLVNDPKEITDFLRVILEGLLWIVNILKSIENSK